MKSMRISATEKVIEIEYNTVQKPREVYEQLYKFEQERCCLNSNVLTYDLTETKSENIGFIVRTLLQKSCDTAKMEKTNIDLGTKIQVHFEAIIENGKLFKITLIKEDGTIGKYGFGCWQYGRILNINDWLETFRLEIKNSRMDEAVPKIAFSEDIDLLIEIGEIQF